jgi:hypothetical protein
MRSNNNNKLKAFVRFDGSGRIIPSSLIVQAFKPAVGNYVEIDAKECCNYTTTTSTTTVAPTTTTTTTAILTYEFNLAVDNSAINACLVLPDTNTFYSDSEELGIGVHLYNDPTFIAFVSDGWYASPINGLVYEVIAGVINSFNSCE